MGGGIIINRAKVLVTTATDPCIYANLPDHCKDKVDEIAAKAPDQRTDEDCKALAGIIVVGVHC